MPETTFAMCIRVDEFLDLLSEMSKGGADMKPCPECKEPMLVHPNVASADRLYCIACSTVMLLRETTGSLELRRN